MEKSGFLYDIGTPIPEEEQYFIGFLVNVDDSLNGFDLGSGFSIQKRDLKEIKKFVDGSEDPRIFENTWKTLAKELGYSWFDWHGESFPIYVIHKDKDFLIIRRKDGSEALIYGEDCIEIEDYPDSYVQPVLRLMRLHQPGDIRMLTYVEFKGDVTSFPGIWRGHYEIESFHLEEGTHEKLRAFIDKTNLPLHPQYVNLAFESFEQSYETSNPSLSFISLMISMEVLFNPGMKIKQTVSRCAAGMLGSEKKDSKKIYDDMNGLYLKRCELVHEGTTNITEEERLRLRSYVRGCILKAMEINLSKKELILNCSW